MVKEEKILDDGLDLRILSVVDGKKNVTKISDEIGLKYKNVLARLKTLERKGIIKLEKTKDITEGLIIKIENKYLSTIKNEILTYKKDIELIGPYFRDKHKFKVIKDFLKFVDDNRFISEKKMMEYLSSLKEDDRQDMFFILTSLENTGFLRHRIETTRITKYLLRGKY